MKVSARLRERSRLRVYLRLKRRQSCAWSFGCLQLDFQLRHRIAETTTPLQTRFEARALVR